MSKNRVHNILIALAGVLFIISMESLGLFNGINAYCYNLAFRLRGPTRASGEIVIAAIDEKSLRELGRWPLQRRHYAALLDAVLDARVVGFTVIMAEPSEDDAVLAKAAALHGKVVFPLYIDDRFYLEFPSRPLSHFPAGHLHVEQDIDGVVRKVFNSLRFDSRMIPSFATVVHGIATGSSQTNLPSVQGGRDVIPSASIFQANPININYRGPRGTFPIVSLADIVDGRVSPEFFRGKIVLVGTTAAGIEERLITPFTQQRNRMSAVEVQANIVDNLLGRDSIVECNYGARLIICLAAAVALFVLFMALTETGAAFVMISALAAISISVYLLFTRQHLWVDPDIFYFSTTFLYIATFLFKLDEAAGRLQLEYSAIALHLAAQGRSVEGDEAGRGLAGYLSTGGINTKIKVLTEATKQLIDRSAQLEAANRELESFSYSVSHDLRAPLRIISGFIAALEEDYGDRIDEEGKGFLKRISASAARMEKLVTALLDLSRLSRADLRRKAIDLADIVREIAGDLEKSDPGHHVQFVIAGPVPVEADADLMRVVMENLLGNAWKFTGRTPRPVIEFGMKEIGGERCFFVRDNGAGFDMTYAEKLFVPFQRLHSENEFHGTGIGLATVQRIIHRHGGRIWAESGVDGGATFYFTL